jgi:aspartate kinase
MLELASLGAGVMHSRSIEFAKKFRVPIHVRSSFSDIEGTMIVDEPESETAPVSGATLTRDEARVTVHGVPDVPGTSLEIFSRIAARKIAVDMVVQNVGREGRTDISFSVGVGELRATLEAVREAAGSIGVERITHDDQVSKVSVVGLGMAKQTGVAHQMFRALADAGVNIQMITTSEIKISAMVARDQAQIALRTVHGTFNLQDKPKDAKTWAQIRADRASHADMAMVVSRLRDDALEELTLTSIAMVDDQALITLRGVPDQPGFAADMFDAIGGAGIFVDLIVQGIDGRDDRTSISLTVPEEDLEMSLEVAKSLAARYGLDEISGTKHIAKLSVSGIGLRSHTHVGTVMFRALADIGINVLMINTSELQVNAVVDSARAKEGLEALKVAFAESLG